VTAGFGEAGSATPPLFLADDGRLPADPQPGDAVVLDGPEGRHAATVRRLGPGERVDLTDGAGLRVVTTVAAAGRDRLDLVVVRRERDPEPAPRLVVVQALAKGERGELAVELLTEVGADEVVPWSASRSVVEWRGERGAKALARWRATAREAAKQSRRTRLPVVTEPATTARVAERLRGAALGLVLDPAGTVPLATVEPLPAGEVVLVVGPEGGATPQEVAAFTSAGGRLARLGPTVLRTSTAGAAAVAVLSARAGRWA
jgi:16S rRNA (uracil1498-N3)-methyltransferase